MPWSMQIAKFECRLLITTKTLKGLSTLKWTCSVFKDYGLLILPLTLIFYFGETPENGRDSGKICPIQSANPISSRWQILVIRPAYPLCSGRQIRVLHLKIPRLHGFVKWNLSDWLWGIGRGYLTYKNAKLKYGD